MKELSGCVITFEQTRIRLERVERQLAERLKLGPRNIRGTILKLIRAGRLPEDELVAEWNEQYSNYMDWVVNHH
jgi:hypothetical protein